jgi:hypothetical protein
LYSIGVIGYFALTGELAPPKINTDHLNKTLNDSINKNKLIKIISDLLNKETSSIKTIYDLINQLPQLNKKLKSRDISFKKEIYTSEQTTLAFKDMFEARRKYFEDLEKERRKKLNISTYDNIFIKEKEIKKEVENLGGKKIRQLEERKAFYRNESGEYFKNLNKKRKNHFDNIVNHTRNYYKNLNAVYITKEKFIEECKTFFNKISDQMKKYADDMKNENIKYFKAIIKRSNLLTKKYDEDDIKEEYREKLNEAKQQLNRILEEAKKYYINLTDEARKYHIAHFTVTGNKIDNNRLNTVLDETLNYYKNTEKESRDYYNSIIHDYKKSLNEINKRLTYLKENREMLSHFNENLSDAIVKNSFLKKMFKYSSRSCGNFCLIDVKQNNKAEEIIKKYFEKYSLNSKSLAIELIAGNNTLQVILKKIYEKYKKINYKKQERIIGKIKEIKTDYKNILDRNYHEILKDFINVKQANKKINNNLLIKSVVEFLKCFCFKNFPLIIIIDEFHNIDMQCMKILFELTKDIASLPILIFGLYDRSKMSRENLLNDIL